MPLCSVISNIALADNDRGALLQELSHRTAEMLGKPQRYVMVSYRHNPDMLFDGSTEPLAYVELKSIGLPGERTLEFSQILCGLLSERLDVPADRVYIEFADAERHLWGWDGGTFAR